MTLFWFTDKLEMFFSKTQVVVWAVALSTSSALAHPYFPGKLVSNPKDLLAEYDYVVVGGGASGLTVANRLSENPGGFYYTALAPCQGY